MRAIFNVFNIWRFTYSANLQTLSPRDAPTESIPKLGLLLQMISFLSFQLSHSPGILVRRAGCVPSLQQPPWQLPATVPGVRPKVDRGLTYVPYWERTVSVFIWCCPATFAYHYCWWVRFSIPTRETVMVNDETKCTLIYIDILPGSPSPPISNKLFLSQSSSD